MAEDFEEEAPRKKRKKKPFSKKQMMATILIILIFSAGAFVQHFVIEPLYGETVEDDYVRCLTQKDVINERYQDCENQSRACEYQLNQCLGR